MKPVLFAVLTALCWSAGSFFEKKGLGLAGLPPVMGITLRTAVAVVVLGALSYPHWSSLSGMHIKPLLYLVLGGGVLAGSLGMFFFYAAIGSGQLSRVMPVAFGLTPLMGFLIGVWEQHRIKQRKIEKSIDPIGNYRVVTYIKGEN